MARVQTLSATQFLADATQRRGLELVHLTSPLFSGCKYVSQQMAELVDVFDPTIGFSEATGRSPEVN